MKKLIYFVFIFLISCSGDEENKTLETRIKGNVTDYYSGKSISYIKIGLAELSQDPSNPQLVNLNPYDKSNFIGEIITDSIGNFDANFRLNESGKYKLVYKSDSLISKDNYDIIIGKTNNMSIEIKPFTYGNIKISCSNPDIERISINICNDQYKPYDFTAECKIWEDYSDLYFQNDFPLILRLIPDAYLGLTIIGRGNDMTGAFLDTSIYIQNVDTSFVEIVY